MSESCKTTTEEKTQATFRFAYVSLLEFALSHSVKEVLQKFLDETEKLTGSQIEERQKPESRRLGELHRGLISV